MSKPKLYWDAVVFLRFFNDESGANDCLQVLEAATRKECEIFTSAFTLVEVLHIKKHNRIDPSKRGLVEEYFTRECFKLVLVDRKTGEKARDLYWDHGVEPKDAIHVASALIGQVDKLNTFDEELLRKDGKITKGLYFKIKQESMFRYFNEVGFNDRFKKERLSQKVNPGLPQHGPQSESMKLWGNLASLSGLGVRCESVASEYQKIPVQIARLSYHY